MIKLKSLLSEKIDGITFREESRGSHHGQSDLTLYADDVAGNYMGHIDYSVYQGEPSVQMIKVPRHNQRKGIATALVKHLQSLFPDVEIDMGVSTEDGEKFLKSLNPTYTKNTEYETLTNRLTFLKKAEHKLSQWVNAKKGPTNSKISDAFNRISDEMWDIEQKLRYMVPGKTLIPTSEITTEDLRSESDAFYYHATPAPYIPFISKNGLKVRGIKKTVSNYSTYSRGKIFLTDVGALDWWVHTIAAHAFDQFDDEKYHDIAIFRVPKDKLTDVKIDTEGSNDSKGNSYYVEHDIPANIIEFVKIEESPF